MTTNRKTLHHRADLLDRVTRVVLERKLNGEMNLTTRDAGDEALEMWLAENEKGE